MLPPVSPSGRISSLLQAQHLLLNRLPGGGAHLAQSHGPLNHKLGQESHDGCHNSTIKALPVFYMRGLWQSFEGTVVAAVATALTALCGQPWTAVS